MKKINFDEKKVCINNLKIIKYDEDNKYIIKFHEDKCIMLYNNNIVSNPIEICEKYNIFDGKIIIVDIKSFHFTPFSIENAHPQRGRLSDGPLAHCPMATLPFTHLRSFYGRK